MGEPPSLLILPPLIKEVEVIELAEFVVKMGAEGVNVLKLNVFVDNPIPPDVFEP